ncbi:MAG: hypothetical protein QM765_21045 [Myxococcales bacterium]
MAENSAKDRVRIAEQLRGWSEHLARMAQWLEASASFADPDKAARILDAIEQASHDGKRSLTRDRIDFVAAIEGAALDEGLSRDQAGESAKVTFEARHPDLLALPLEEYVRLVELLVGQRSSRIKRRRTEAGPQVGRDPQRPRAAGAQASPRPRHAQEAVPLFLG